MAKIKAESTMTLPFHILRQLAKPRSIVKPALTNLLQCTTPFEHPHKVSLACPAASPLSWKRKADTAQNG